MFDQNTLFAVNAIICLTGTIVLYFNWRSNPEQDGLKLFFYGYAVILVASVLLLTGDERSLYVTAAITGLFCGLTLTLQGFMRFWRIRVKHLLPTVWMLSLVATLIAIYFVLLREDSTARVMLVSAFSIVISSVEVWLLLKWYRQRREQGAANRPDYGVRLFAISVALGIVPKVVRLSQLLLISDPWSDPGFISLSASMWFFDVWRSMFMIMAVIMMTSEMHQRTLRRLAMSDSLTGLRNRRAFEDDLKLKKTQLHANEGCLALLMIDLDNFKSVNDKYGHMAGDAVLRHFAALLNDVTRAQDINCRYGGEEFLLLISTEDAAAAFEVAERLRKTVSVNPAIYEGVPIPMTVSVGIAMFTVGDISQSLCTQRADNALYQAKEQGRNRVVMAA